MDAGIPIIFLMSWMVNIHRLDRGVPFGIFLSKHRGNPFIAHTVLFAISDQSTCLWALLVATLMGVSKISNNTVLRKYIGLQHIFGGVRRRKTVKSKNFCLVFKNPFQASTVISAQKKTEQSICECLVLNTN